MQSFFQFNIAKFVQHRSKSSPKNKIFDLIIAYVGTITMRSGEPLKALVDIITSEVGKVRSDRARFPIMIECSNKTLSLYSDDE